MNTVARRYKFALIMTTAVGNITPLLGAAPFCGRRPVEAVDKPFRLTMPQPLDLAGRSRAVNGGPQPQRDENDGVYRRAARRAFKRTDACVQRRQVERLHEGPDGARRVIRRKERVEFTCAKLDLLSLQSHQPRYSGLDDRIAPPRWRNQQLTLVEQRYLALVKPRLPRPDVGQHTEGGVD